MGGEGGVTGGTDSGGGGGGSEISVGTVTYNWVLYAMMTSPPDIKQRMRFVKGQSYDTNLTNLANLTNLTNRRYL